MQPAHSQRPAGMKLAQKQGLICSGCESGHQAERLKSLDLSIWVRRVTEPAAAQVVGVIRSDASVVVGQHRAAGTHALAPTLTRGIISLRKE
jgi:hypothetical protein